MWEILYIAAGLRQPIVMAVANRCLGGPINIHNDHSDAMGARDSGWVQIFCENSQEVYDASVEAWRIAEHPDVQMPVMVNFDGFTISHTMENVYILEDADVKKLRREEDLHEDGGPARGGRVQTRPREPDDHRPPRPAGLLLRA